MKLSKKLKEILILMNSGWELGCNYSLGWWLQQSGCGRGGECKKIHGKTYMWPLIELDLIAPHEKEFPSQKYHLTDKGKEFVNDNR